MSPNQINFQMPSSGEPSALAPSGIVVTTAAGASDAYPLAPGSANPSVGLFTLDSSGCGRGDVLNVGSDGTLSVNSPANSLSPGQYLAAYGTGAGFVYNAPQDGYPAQSAPLATAATGLNGAYDFVQANSGPYNWWAGRAPALVGVDQFNLQVSPAVREGCAVPFQVVSSGISQPVTIAIRSGGGPCVDPPAAVYGTITWQKAVSVSLSNRASEADSVIVSLQESPGKQPPPVPVFVDSNVTGASLPGATVFFGPSCPIPGYRSLDAGSVIAEGPGLGPLPVGPVPLPKTQVSGLVAYQAALPAGTIQAGRFAVMANGGSDVGAFNSSVQIGAGLQFSIGLAGTVFPCNRSVTISWTGGDPMAWVTVSKIGHAGPYDSYLSWQARVSDGSITIPSSPSPPATCPASFPIDLLIQMDPDPSENVTFLAPGLTLGGLHTWRYTYMFPAFAQ